MKGHIVKRAKGTYSVVIELGTHPETGKRQQKWITVEGENGKAATKEDAERALHKQITAVYEGDFVSPDKVTVAESFEQWLERRRGAEGVQ